MALIIPVNDQTGHQVFMIGAMIDKAHDESFRHLLSYFYG